eukprot:5483113-Heterocapsa_arctica.AAC.1
MDKQNKVQEQAHEYVHGGLLHRKEMGKINKNTQDADEQTQQYISERINEEEDNIDTQEYEL